MKRRRKREKEEREEKKEEGEGREEEREGRMRTLASLCSAPEECNDAMKVGRGDG